MFLGDSITSISFWEEMLPNSRTIFWDWLSVVFLVIIGIFVIKGFVDGFFKSLLGFCKQLIATIVALLLCRPVANMINGTSVGTSLFEKLNSSFTSMGSPMTEVITSDMTNKNELIKAGLEKAKIPASLTDYIAKLISPLFDSAEPGTTLAYFLAKGLTLVILVVASFVVIYIVARIIIFCLRHLTKGINKIPVVGFVNRLGGLILGLLIGVYTVSFISYGLIFLNGVNGDIANFFSNLLCFNDETKWSVAKAFYNANIIEKLIELIP